MVDDYHPPRQLPGLISIPFFPIKWVILHTDVYHAYLTKLHHGQDLKTKARATPTQFIQQEI